MRVVLVQPAGALVQLPGLQHLVVVDARHRGRDEIAEVGIALPLDRPVGDALDDRRRVLDSHLLRPLVLVAPADAPGVEDVDLERMLLEQLEEAVPLQVVRHREEGIRARDAQRLAGLVGPACSGSFRLPEHEEGRCLRPFELRDCGDDVVVLVQDQQKVRLVDLPVRVRLDHGERESRAPVLRIALVVEVDLVAVLGNVL